MRRGIKEMDLILSAFADNHLKKMTDAELTLYDAMLSENDHDLYQWVTGQVKAPERFSAMVAWRVLLRRILRLSGFHPRSELAFLLLKDCPHVVFSNVIIL